MRRPATLGDTPPTTRTCNAQLAGYRACGVGHFAIRVVPKMAAAPLSSIFVHVVQSPISRLPHAYWVIFPPQFVLHLA